MAVTVLAGSTFCISDERGDIREGAVGFFARDTRHVARSILTLDGLAPQLLFVEGLRRVDDVRRRLAPERRHRAGRGTGLRVRRETAARGTGTRSVERSRAGRQARSRGRIAARPLQRRLLVRAARRLHLRDGLDREKRPIDSLGSDIGHLLWSGIVPDERVASVVDPLTGAELWSGWGVRTLASDELAYNPLRYHNGTVWPHDSCLIALGLARYGRHAEAQRIMRRMTDAAARLSSAAEVFAGFSRDEWGVPIVYPTPTKPQAWAAGTTVSLLAMLLGLQPDPRRGVLTSTAPGRTRQARIEDARVLVDEFSS